jgi:hypothetical protein
MSNLVNKYFDLAKVVLWADTEDTEAGKRARMIFNFRDGNPRITVYTGGAGSEGVVSYPCDTPTMVGILNLLKDVVKSTPGTKYSIDSLTTIYVDNKPSNEKRVASTLYVGKSKEGLIYLSVISENRPKLIFTIKSSPFHVFRDGEKNVVADAKVSELLANGIADMMLNVISQAVLSYSNEEYETGVRKVSLVKQNGQATTPQVEFKQPQQNLDILKDLEDIGL